MPSVCRLAARGAISLAVGLYAMAGLVRAEDGLWLTDFEAAKAKAKAEKKLMLVDFTGSDWCGWCKRLKAEVFDKDAFKSEAPKRYILVELDYPHEKKLSEELQQQNKALSEHYKIEGFPTILMMDAGGQVIAKTGYRAGGPEEYVKHLADFTAIYENVVKMKGAGQGPGARPRQAARPVGRRLFQAQQRNRQPGGMEQGNCGLGPGQQGGAEVEAPVPPVDG